MRLAANQTDVLTELFPSAAALLGNDEAPSGSSSSHDGGNSSGDGGSARVAQQPERGLGAGTTGEASAGPSAAGTPPPPRATLPLARLVSRAFRMDRAAPPDLQQDLLNNVRAQRCAASRCFAAYLTWARACVSRWSGWGGGACVRVTLEWVGWGHVRQQAGPPAPRVCVCPSGTSCKPGLQRRVCVCVSLGGRLQARPPALPACCLGWSRGSSTPVFLLQETPAANVFALRMPAQSSNLFISVCLHSLLLLPPVPLQPHLCLASSPPSLAPAPSHPSLCLASSPLSVSPLSLYSSTLSRWPRVFSSFPLCLHAPSILPACSITPHFRDLFATLLLLSRP
eukprot:365018-Chlamydomonas_euryale.AAC.9